ncbi:MAG: hypothetical protein IT210_07295 [Armatimonadetes bacterium]|nr:hypothetical protein [Armatimonadota bacterium]
MFYTTLGVMSWMTALTGVPGAEAPFGVPARPWEEGYGNHRARVQVSEKAEAVRVRIPWRRRDLEPEKRHIQVVDAATGKEVSNIARIRVERESGDLAFEPVSGAGEYDIYYMPYQVQPDGGYYYKGYLPAKDAASPEWLQKHRLTPEGIAAGGWQSLPEAKDLEIQARTDFDRFDPMEVIATRAETESLLSAHAGEGWLLFPEDRRFPIRMTRDLPLRWIEKGPSDRFQGEACRNEFYAFQIGVYAARQPVRNVRIEFGDMRPERGGQAIPAAAFRCVNLGGIDWEGRPFAKSISVEAGRVGTLWCGVQIPEDAAAGPYRASLTVKPENAPAKTLDIALTVLPEARKDHGDDEPWRHSRLRWLDSTIAIDDEIVAPYTPLAVRGRTVKCLGRQVKLAPSGLPESIRSGTGAKGREVLAAPVAMVVDAGSGSLVWREARFRRIKKTPGQATWESSARAEGLRMSCRTQMEFDGHLLFAVEMKADRETPVRDIRLEIPFRKEAASYLMGIGRKGGFRPQEWTWKWGGKIYYDSFWIGDAQAGLQCELRGASYSGPLVNLYWKIGQLAPPPAWHNDGKGGCTVTEEGDRVVARAYSGERTLKAGETIRFEFAFLVTPVKPLDTASHFDNRYYHSYEPVDKIKATGANVINIHHATRINPFINYPFIAVKEMSDYVREAHERDMKVKIYYTVRELTVRVAELWALRSLGTEVLAPGPAGGYPPLQEHLAENYTQAWYQPLESGEIDIAVVTSGISRWYNYYLEGLAWLLKNVQIDGLYNDDVTYDRQIMKRVRKIMNRIRPGCMIDLHSNTAFSHGPANQYMEYFPYIDRLWFGESFDYDESPDYWLTEISGIPYGLMGEMLQNGGNRWRGMVYGITTRLPYSGDPSPLWKLWDEFGIDRAQMAGYWDPACPVRTDSQAVPATAYVRKGRVLVALASWAKEETPVRLTIDWKATGIAPAKARLHAPAIEDYQEERFFGIADPIPVQPGKGWLVLVEER